MGPFLALLFLALVASALIFAAVYAIYAKPKSAGARERKRHVVNGFRLAGGVLAGFVLVGALVTGIGVGFCGTKLGPAPLSFSSRPFAFALIAISLALLILTVQRWAKYLGGWIGYGALNGLLMASSGHMLNNPAIPVPRSLSLSMTAVAIVSALACLRFTEDYELNLVDKIAVVGWIVWFAVAANVEKFGLAAITLAGVGLLLARLYYGLTQRSARHRRITSRAV